MAIRVRKLVALSLAAVVAFTSTVSAGEPRFYWRSSEGLIGKSPAAPENPGTSTDPLIASVSEPSLAYEVGQQALTPLSASGGTAPYRWSGVGLPSGVTVSQTGQVQATVAGEWPSVNAKVTDSAVPPNQATVSFGLTASYPELIASVSPSSLALEVGGAAQPLSAVGGLAPYKWTGFGTMPSAVTISPEGILKATSEGSWTGLQAQVEDSAVPPSKKTVTFSLHASYTVPPLVAGVSQPSLALVVGASVQPFSVTGGHGPYSWSGVGLPSAVTISPEGILQATASGAWTELHATVTDSAVPPSTKTVAFDLTASYAPLVATVSRPTLALGFEESANPFTVTGGLGPYVWTGVNLPSEVTLSPEGTLQAATGGTWIDLKAMVTDSAVPAAQATVTFSLNAAYPPLEAAVSQPSLAYEVGKTALSPFSATGGLAPYTWSGLNLPNEVTLSPAGKLQSSAAGTWTDLKAKVTDSAVPPNTATVTFSLASTAISAPAASGLMAHDFQRGGVAVDYRFMYDGSGSGPSQPVTVSQADSVIVDFGMPVQASSAALGFGNMDPSARARLDYEQGGQWIQGALVSSSDSLVNLGSTIVAQRFRVVADNAYAFNLTEFRVGAGPAHSWPSFQSNTYLTTLSDVPSEIQIAATGATTYGGQPLSFSVIAGQLPAGASLSSGGKLTLPAYASGSGWNFTVRVVDGEGFGANKDFAVGAPTVPASQLMATNVSRSGSPVDYKLFYDGLNSAGLATDSSTPIVFDFGRPVSFDRALIEGGSVSAPVRIEMQETDGSWTPLGTNSLAGSQLVTFTGTMVAQKVRVTRATAGATLIYEFRLGDGPAHPAPAITQGGNIADLAASAQSVQLTATSGTYYTQAPLTYAVTAGSLPPGATLSTGGRLDLPAALSTGSSWTFTVKVTDGLGFYSEKSLTVTNSTVTVPASMIVAMNVVNSGNAATDIYRTFYDGDLAQPAGGGYQNINTTTYLTFDFGRTVSFDRYVAAFTSTSGHAILEIETTPNTWQQVSDYSTTAPANAEKEVTLGSVYTARRVRMKSLSNLSLTEFRLGAGPKQPAPVFQPVPGQVGMLVATLGASSQSIQLKATSSETNYTQAPIVYSLASGSLPDGASLSPSGVLSLPAAGDTSGPGWAPVVRAKDGVGFYTDTQLFISTAAVPASTVMATNVSRSQGTGIPDYRAFYDGNLTTGPVEQQTTNSPVTYLTFDFGRTVSFDRYTASFAYASGHSYLEIETTPNNWLRVSDYMPNTANTALTVTLGATSTTTTPATTFTAQRVRLTSSGNQTWTEFRLGGGPAQVAPVLSQSGVVANLGASAQTVQLTTASPPGTNYTQAPLAYTVVSGTMPAGASLSASGLLSLPAGSSALSSGWNPKVRVTDGVGFYTETQLYIGAAATASADQVLPLTATYDPGGANTSVAPSIFYDNNAATFQAVLAGKSVVFDFGQPVATNLVAASLGVAGYDIKVEVEWGGQFVNLVTLRTGAALTEVSTPGSLPTVASRFKFTNMHATSTLNVRELRLGRNGVYPMP